MRFLVDNFSFFQYFPYVSHPMGFLALLFLMTSQVLIFLGFPHSWQAIFLWLLLGFSFCFLILAFFTIIHPSVIHFAFVLFEVHWAHWMCKLMFLFSHYILISFCDPFFLSSSSDTPIVWLLAHITLAHISLRLCVLFFILFSLCSDCILSIDPSSPIHSCFLLPVHVYI